MSCSRKAFPAFLYVLSCVLKGTFPHGGKAFSMFLKKPSDAFFSARCWYSDSYVMCQKIAYTRAGGLPSVYARFSATLHRMNIHSVINILHEYAFFSYGFSSFVPRLCCPFFPFHRAWLVVLLALSRSASVSLLTPGHRLPFVLHVFLFRIPGFLLLHGCLLTVSSSVCAL